MTQTNESICLRNDSIGTNKWSDEINSHNECLGGCSHSEEIKPLPLPLLNPLTFNQDKIDSPDQKVINGRSKESIEESLLKHKLEVCKNLGFQDDLHSELHYQSAMWSELNTKREEYENFDEKDQNSKLTAPITSDLKSEDNMHDIPMDINEANWSNWTSSINNQMSKNSEIQIINTPPDDLNDSHNKKTEEMLWRFRSIVSDSWTSTKSKTKNLHFFATTEKIINSYKRKKIKEATTIKSNQDWVLPSNKNTRELNFQTLQANSLKHNINQNLNKKKEMERQKSNVFFHQPLVIDKQPAEEESTNKDFMEVKSIKSCQNIQDVNMNEEFSEVQLSSLEPKDISNKNQRAFESYLSQVSLMYFETSSNQWLQGLNELTSLVSNNQSDLPIEQTKSVANFKEKQPEQGKTLKYSFNCKVFYRYSTLDALWNPLRLSHVFEDWSPKEIVMFETWIWKFGKNFYLFPKFIKTKSVREITLFYQWWKRTSHYKVYQQIASKSHVEDINDWVFK